jgi:hypothetical protein
MHKLLVTRFDGKKFLRVDTLDILENWKNENIANNIWGYPERHVQDNGDYDARLIIKKYEETDEETLEVIPMVHLKAEYEITIEDISSEIQEQQAKKAKKDKIKAKRKAIEAGHEVFAFMSVLNEDKKLNPNQKDQILNDSKIQEIAKYLSFGRLARAKTLIENYNIDGILITQNDKDEILELINEYLN